MRNGGVKVSSTGRFEIGLNDRKWPDAGDARVVTAVVRLPTAPRKTVVEGRLPYQSADLVSRPAAAGQAADEVQIKNAGSTLL